MNCRTAQLLLTLDRPHAPELSPDDRALLAQHLATCETCRAIEQGDHQADEIIGRALRNVDVPAGLEKTLHAVVDRQDLDQRQRWWTQAGRTAAIAAGLLVLIGGLLWWNLSQRPVLDPAGLDNDFVVALVTPPSAEEIEDQFRHKGHTVVVPRDLNYGLLVDARLAEFRGRQVPLLLFDRGDVPQPGYARLFILSAQQFNLSHLAGTHTSPSGYRYRVEISHQASGLYAYVFVYTGENLDWLRVRPSTF